MLHETSGKEAGQARQASFAGADFHKTMCHRQTKWRSRTLPRRLASWHCSSNSKSEQSGLCLIQLIQGRYLSDKPATDRRLARQIHILTCIVSGKNCSGQGAAKPLQGQLASRRDSYWAIAFAGLLTSITGKTPGPAFFRRSFNKHHR